MFSAAINTIIIIGTVKSILIGVGITSAIGAIVCWVLLGAGCYEDDNLLGKFMRLFAVLGMVIMIGCIVAYNVPQMNPNIAIAKVVAVQLDKYAETHPESIYNPDTMLTEVDMTVKGLAASVGGMAIQLPGYIEKFAKGGVTALITTEKSVDQMTKEELIKKVKELENK